MVSSSGEAAISGISLVDSINILLIQIMSALATGGAVVISQYIGKEKLSDACAAAKQLLYVITIMATAIMTFSLFYCTRILQFVFGNIDADVMQNAATYFRLTAISYPFLAVYNAGAALLRSINNSKASMYISLLMNIVNITGNAILIYGFGQGVAGAGISTLASRILAAVVILILISKSSNLVYVKKMYKPELNLKMINRILHIGIPSGMENGMFQIGKLVVQNLVSTFGTSAIAANAIANSISSMANIPGNAIGLGLITVVGQCVGANDYEQSVFYTKRLMKVAYVSMGVLNILLYFTAFPLVGLFSSLSMAASTSAVQILQVFAIFSATIWVPSFVTPNALRAAGDVRFTMLTSMFSMWAFRIGFSYVLAKYMNLGLIGVWYAMYVDWAVRSLIFTIRFKRGKWKRFKVI